MKKFLAAAIIAITLPILPAVSSAATLHSSYNWAGYEATSGTFTAVSGTWTVPTIASATSTQADVTWVGIGGVTSHDLIQAGTQVVIDHGPGGSGTPVYQAWYETLPQVAQQVPLTISPGDSITASVTQTAAAAGTTPAEWTISIRDNTTGQSYQNSVAYNSSMSSAEWIEEMPSDGSQFVPLDNFGSVSFTNGAATRNGVSGTIAGSGGQPLTMANSAGQALASPSALGSDGASFTVTRSNVAVASGFGTGYVIQRVTGRGWHRTGVEVEGFAPVPVTISVPVPSSTNNYWQRWLRILQQFQQIQQQMRLRNIRLQ